MEQAITSESPGIARIKKEHGEAVTAAALVKILESLIRFFNVGKTMNNEQLIETTKLIMQEFFYLKLEDLKLCFDKMKSGGNGVMYDRIDGQTIMLNLREYCADRIEVAERISANNHETNKAQTKESEDGYLIEIDGKCLRDNESEYDLVSKRELATKFNYQACITIRKNFLEGGFKSVKIIYADKPEIGLIDYIKENNPKLLQRPPQSTEPSYTDWKAKNQEAATLIKEVIEKDAELKKVVKKEIKEKSTKYKTAVDFKNVAKLYAEGKDKFEISNETGLSIPQVTRILTAINQEGKQF